MALFDFLKKKKQQEKAQRGELAKVREVEDKVEPTKTSFDLETPENFVLESPHVTERARGLAGLGQYTFRVHPKATKREIRESVERLYRVNVEKIRITKVHEKPRRRGLTEGVKKGYKKAVVALRKGEAIDIF